MDIKPWEEQENRIYLDKSNVLGVNSEALSATHDVVLAYKAMDIPTDTARKIQWGIYKHTRN